MTCMRIANMTIVARSSMANIFAIYQVQTGPKLPGGVWRGDTPLQSRESSPRRANDSKSSGQFLQMRKKLPPNVLTAIK